MRGNLIISFNATDSQVDMLLDFCKEKTGSAAIITVCQPLGSRFALGLSIFENRPQVYMGILDLDSKKVVEDISITDDELRKALNDLDYKYAFATTRKNPVANSELVMAWIDYINRNINKKGIPIEPDEQQEQEMP